LEKSHFKKLKLILKMQNRTEIPTPDKLPRGKKRDLTAWPIQAFNTANPLILAQLADSVGLASQSSWFLDQLLHYFGQWTLVYKDGLVDPRSTAKLNLGSEFSRGCWFLACRLPRSKLVPKQIAQPEFSSLTPLILAGIKRYQGVPYSKWSREGLEAVMPEDLAEACITEWPEIEIGELLRLRQEGLLVRSGPREGTSRDPKAAWILYGINDSEIGLLNKLSRLMITQCWVCHPDLRHQDMICDPLNWDSHPEPLIKTEPVAKWTTLTKLPWE